MIVAATDTSSRDAAVASLRHALALDPATPQAWRCLADLLDASGDRGAAADAYLAHVRNAERSSVERLYTGAWHGPCAPRPHCMRTRFQKRKRNCAHSSSRHRPTWSPSACWPNLQRDSIAAKTPRICSNAASNSHRVSPRHATTTPSYYIARIIRPKRWSSSNACCATTPYIPVIAISKRRCCAGSANTRPRSKSTRH